MPAPMTILDPLKNLLGIGIPTVTLDGVAQVAHPGDVLRGEVVVQGGDYDVTVRELTVRLEEQRLTYTSPVPVGDPERLPLRVVAQVKLDLGEFVLASGQRLQRPFELAVPPRLEASAGPLGHAVVAELEIVGGNPVAMLPVTVRDA